MSRFNNPKALASIRSEGAGSLAIEGTTCSTAILDRPRDIPASRPAPAVLFPVQDRPNTIQVFCFAVLCVYLLSAYANDITLHLFHVKAYLSTVAVVLLPLLFVATGAIKRGFRTPIGNWWFAFAVWLVICAPFSVWRSDTVSQLSNYFLRGYLLYFVMCACVVTVHQLRTLIRVFGIGALVVAFTCMAFGSGESGRFSVPGSPFFSNPNELGLQLLLGIVFLMFSFFGTSAPAKLVSVIGILMSANYMLKTGSRGILIAALVVCVLIFLLGRRKLMFLAVALPAFVLALVLTPAHTRHRLTLIFAAPKTATINTEEELSAVGSQLQREQLLRDSISYALHHPIVGAGPGEFMVAEAGDKERQGELAQWRGTHNSYTQVASEAGLPGFIFYVAAILICLRMNFRLYRRTSGRKGLEEIAALSLCMFLGTAGYAISTFFFHVAFSSYLPILAGLSGATYTLAQPILGAHGRNGRLAARTS